MLSQIKNWVICAALAVCSLNPAAALAGGKYALLIGNSEYQQQGEGKSWTTLPNPANDVALVGRSLDAIGFEVTSLSNGNWREMRDAIESFSNSIGDAEMVVFYFAGHGFEYGRRNYLVPVDASLEASAGEIDQTFIEFEELAGRLYNEGTTIFMLDACRTDGEITQTSGNNGAVTRSAPAPVIIEPATRQAASGGVREFDFEPGSQVAVLYSTGRGVPAYDSAPPPEDVSPFAYEVANAIVIPAVDVGILFSTIRKRVLDRTKVYWPPQAPFTYNSLDPHTYLTLDPPTDVSPSTPGSELELEAIDLTLEQLEQIDEPKLADLILGQYSASQIEVLAVQGDPIATYLFGYMLSFGIGAPQDLERARQFLAKAAEQGTPYGQLEYGYFLQNYATSDEDRMLALEMFKSAAEQDYSKARAHYASVLMAGSLVPPTYENYMAGVEQVRLAAKGGYSYAYYMLWLLEDHEGKQEAEAGLRRLVAGGRSDAHVGLCQVLLTDGRLDEAMPSCVTAAQEGFPDGFALMAKASYNVVTRSGSVDDARFWMRQALSRRDLRPDLCTEMMEMQSLFAEISPTQGGGALIDACLNEDK